MAIKDVVQELEAKYFMMSCDKSYECNMCRKTGICGDYCPVGSYSACDEDECASVWDKWWEKQEMTLALRAEAEGELGDAIDMESPYWKDWIPKPYEKTELDYEWDDGDDCPYVI